jgi:outer membrane protein OmpA-like peptidoglycan-associated protein
MRKILLAAAAFAALPAFAHAQTLQAGGFYIGAEGGVNWLLNTSLNPGGGSLALYPNTGWAAGGVVGYDFVGPRVELEGIYRSNGANLQVTPPPPGAPPLGTFVNVSQTAVMANAYYDFFAGQTIVPYVGAGAGVAFVNTQMAFAGNPTTSSTQFAYQAIIGVGWNVNEQFRVNLDGRYYGTTSPSVSTPAGTTSYSNNNLAIMASVQLKFGAPAVAPPPPPPPAQAPSFMVFFDWDRSNLSQQALNTIKQAANAFKTKGNARITATGHTDTSGPENYNMALSLRRANAVKDALVRDGVPATAIAVIGRGEKGLLVPTADGVREPQNRRVEIVIQ